MNYITTTDLRTKTPELIQVLQSGRSVNLIHRSRIVGKIEPKQLEGKVITAQDVKELKQIANKLNLPKTSYKQRQQLYRKNLINKYGKSIS